MPGTRQSRFKKTAKSKLKPLRFSEQDFDILKLFRPGQYHHLTAETIAAATGRYYKSSGFDRIQRRLRQLWDNDYLIRHSPPWNKIGGSSKAVYVLGKEGALKLSNHYNRKIRPLKNFKINETNTQLWHSLGADYFRVLVTAACNQHQEVEHLYDYPDKHFSVSFTEPIDNSRKRRHLVNPDLVFGLKQNESVIRNFFLEYQRPTNQTRKKMRKKFEAIVRFSKNKIYNREPAKTDYANISNWADLQVLVVVDPETIEALLQTLIQAARDIDRYKVGRRNFLFARLDEFTLSDPASLFSRVWRTPVKRDLPISLLD